MPVLTFISLVDYFECVFGTNVIDLESFKTVVEIKFYNSFFTVNIARCPIPPKSTEDRFMILGRGLNPQGNRVHY